MPVLSDFVVVQGDVNVKMGDGGHVVWERTFNTGGRFKGGGALLMFMVKGLTSVNAPVNVKINSTSVGSIYPYMGADANYWFTQIINIGANILRDGDNELQIEAAPLDMPSSGNLYDNFELRDIVCLFQQHS